jgi:glycosyltransferase involved in cell wall biosynthesis
VTSGGALATSDLRALRVRGPFRGGTGYDYLTRAFARAFASLGVRVQLEEFREWSLPLPVQLQDPFFDQLAAPVAADIDLQFVMPHQVVAAPGVLTANYTMFEATRIPAPWVAHAGRCAVTIVPALSSVEAWTRAGVPMERLRRSPIGVRAGMDAECVAPLPLRDRAGRPVSSYRYRILNLAELGPRKNLLGLLAMWMRATRRTDDAVLILKMNVFRPDLAQLFAADLADLVHRLGTSFDDCAPVCITTEYLPDADLPRLYRTATHYLSMSFGEGWDVPMTEAAAAGLTLIAPRHSGYLEYLDDDSAHLIPVSEEAVDVTGSRLAHVDALLFQGLRWWVPDQCAATELVRSILDGRAPVKASPQRRIIEQYAWERVARQLLAVLAEL